MPNGLRLLSTGNALPNSLPELDRPLINPVDGSFFYLDAHLSLQQLVLLYHLSILKIYLVLGVHFILGL
jgi:hypothetical protein